MNLAKFNRVTHRDIGYLIAGLTIIYAISGIALNHKHDWNPNYIIENSRIYNRCENHKGKLSIKKPHQEYSEKYPGAPGIQDLVFPVREHSYNIC